MPSKLAQVNVKVGDAVKKGAPLLILEAMKMEHVIRAPFDGVIERISFGVGDMVGEGQTLVKFKDE
jgi:3-methylcrotonyl-CoA carboxylase alpha subunit